MCDDKNAPVAAQAQHPVKPVAWMVPRLESFKNVERTNCPPDLQAKLEGTVLWSPSIIGDMPPVTDKHGVTHYPRPLVYAAQAQPDYPGATVADRLDAMADECAPGSQRAADLLAAATIWRKHLAGPAAQTSVQAPAADTLPEVRCDRCGMTVLSKCSAVCPVPDAYENPAQASGQSNARSAIPEGFDTQSRWTKEHVLNYPEAAAECLNRLLGHEPPQFTVAHKTPYALPAHVMEDIRRYGNECLAFGKASGQAQDAVAELVHAMFRSGNEIPIERITITRQQYDAARRAAGGNHDGH